MYQSSKEIGNLIQQDSRSFKASITTGKNTITKGIRSIRFNGGSNGEDDFSIGSTVAQYIEVVLDKIDFTIENKEINISIGLVGREASEDIPMGIYTAAKPKVDENQVTFTAYDRMMKLENVCALDLPQDTDTLAVLKEISKSAGVPIRTENLQSFAIKKPIGYTSREVLSYIAQMYGGFAVCNRSGEIEIFSYVDSQYHLKPSRYWDTFQHSDLPLLLEKITCYTGKDTEGADISISRGSGGRALIFSNPFFTESCMDSVWKKLSGYTYMPGSIRFLGDPRIDPWDILTVEDLSGNTYKVPVMKLTHEFDGGFSTTVEAVGKTEAEQVSGFQGPNTRNMDRYYAELVIMEHAIINKLDVDTARITYATITNLNALNATIENLKATTAEFETAVIGRLDAAEADIDKLRTTDLTAANAKIDVLESNYANIKNLLSGNAGIGDLQNITLTSQNAVIDSALIRLAVIQTVSVADLLAGDISTNKFRILSDDGGILIHGNTQQWRDAAGNVRMQAGRDTNGEFNYYITDANGKVMWNALGLTGDAIKNPIIKDSMVAEDANIAGTKLDIASVTECINGSSATINANRIWFDEKNQNLNQLYVSMSSDILNASNAATGAAGAVQVMDQKLASIQTGIDGIKVNLSEMQGTVDSISDGTTTFTILQEYNDDGTVTLKAVVYKAGKDVTKTMPARWYTWLAKSEKGKRYLKYGYEITVDPKDSGFGTTYVGRLTTYNTRYLCTRDGRKLTTRDGRRLTTWVE